MFDPLMKKIVAHLDPKFDRYRDKAVMPKFTPKSLPDFISVLRRTPKSILSDKDRARMAAVMSFDDKIVRDLMINKSDMVFVHEKDFLGPLTLDKLYKSGYTHFPVMDDKEHIKGIIHTEALNNLEIRDADRASKYTDKAFERLHETDSLEFAMNKMLKTSTFYFLVFNQSEELAGFFTIEMLLEYLLGK